ncbi:MAG: hypothetical protein JWR38_134 [Mucilaginibacter sp.]|nr:hypothetical protein [Mucilaginibacter sp.]
MKKLFNLTFVFGLCAVALLLTISACKKESSNGLNITGKWAAAITNSQTSQFEFKSDHTYESYTTGIDSVTKKSTGIISKSVGKYELKNSRLILSDMVGYINKNNQPGPATELLAANNTFNTASYNLTLNDQGNILSLFFICEVNGMIADCTPIKQTFYQKQ